MYEVRKKIEISASHQLSLDYRSKCENLHGHNWQILICCRSEELDSNGMVIDFTHIKEKIENGLDHQNLNAIFNFNPTAENIAKAICDEIPHCYRVEVEESQGNLAIYTKD